MDQPTTTSETRTEVPANVLPPPRNHRVRPRTLLIGAAVLVAVIAATVYYLVVIAPYESTDDAFVDGYTTLVSSRVAGQVTRLLVRDNEEVRRGEVLIELDPRDYEAALSQARAAFASARSEEAQARAQLEVSEARVA